MRPPDCILVRVGEQALKSEQVQRRWQAILLDNIKAALEHENVKYILEVNPNRIFVYTEQLNEAAKVLQHIFGITSISLAWTCFSGLDEIKLLAADIATEVLRLNEKKSFAIRPHRSGHHKFTSQAVAEEVGAAVKRVTNARVDLSKPEHEIEIECRSRKTYIFTERIQCAGGLPVGSAGKVLALVKNKKDAIATWLIMRRGAHAALIGKDILNLKNWCPGRKLELVEEKGLEDYIKTQKINAVVCTVKPQKSVQKVVKKLNLMQLNPTIALSRQEIAAMSRKILFTGG